MAKIIDRDCARTLVIPLNKNGYLSYSVLKQYFAGAVGLEYENENQNIAILFDETMAKLIPPDGGWDNHVFYVVYPHVSSRPSSRVEEENFFDVNRCKKYMLFSLITEVSAGVFENGSIKNCVTVASSRFAFMAGHCLPKGFPKDKMFKVYDSDGHAYSVRLVLMERYEESGDDFAIVEVQDGQFPYFPSTIASPHQGASYFILGYDGECPYADLSYFKGRVRNVKMYESQNYIIGSPGTTNGCSGGGVFSMNGDLFGICVSGCLDTGSNLATIDSHLQTLRRKLGEPSYSHIVPGHYLMANLPNRKRKREICIVFKTSLYTSYFRKLIHLVHQTILWTQQKNKKKQKSNLQLSYFFVVVESLLDCAYHVDYPNKYLLKLSCSMFSYNIKLIK